MTIWKRKWQWKSQYPGLSARNRITTYPLFGTAIVSFRGGLEKSRSSIPMRSNSKACFKLIFLLTYPVSDPVLRHKKQFHANEMDGWDSLAALHRPKLLQQSLQAEYQPCVYIHSWAHSSAAYCPRCRRIQVVYHRFEIEEEPVVKCMRFHRLKMSDDPHLAQLLVEEKFDGVVEW